MTIVRCRNITFLGLPFLPFPAMLPFDWDLARQTRPDIIIQKSQSWFSKYTRTLTKLSKRGKLLKSTVKLMIAKPINPYRTVQKRSNHVRELVQAVVFFRRLRFAAFGWGFSFLGAGLAFLGFGGGALAALRFAFCFHQRPLGFPIVAPSLYRLSRELPFTPLNTVR